MDHIHLPEVITTDILQAFTDEAFNPADNESMWQYFSRTQPILAREILQRAIFNFDIPGRVLTGHEARTIMIENASFIIRSLGYAGLRESQEPAPTALLPSDEYDDGDQPHAGELGVGQ